MPIQFRRGDTNTVRNTVGLLAEIIIDTERWVATIHDGEHPGGHPLAKENHTHKIGDISGLNFQSLRQGSKTHDAKGIILDSNFTTETDGEMVRVGLTKIKGGYDIGDSSHTFKLTVDEYGRITNVELIPVSGAPPIGVAAGDLTGEFPSPKVASVGGVSAKNIAAMVKMVDIAGSDSGPNTLVKRSSTGGVSFTTVKAREFQGDLQGNISGSAFTFTSDLTGDVTSEGMVTALSETGIKGGTYGAENQAVQLTVDKKGRIIDIKSISMAGALPGGGAGGDLSGQYPSPAVSSVGGASAKDIGNSVKQQHAQNTDKGTTRSTFQIGIDNEGPKLRNKDGLLQVINNANEPSDMSLDGVVLGGLARMYFKGNKLIIQISEGSNFHYKWLDFGDKESTWKSSVTEP